MTDNLYINVIIYCTKINIVYKTASNFHFVFSSPPPANKNDDQTKTLMILLAVAFLAGKKLRIFLQTIFEACYFSRLSSEFS